VTPYGADGLAHAIRSLAHAVLAPPNSLTPLIVALPVCAVLLRRKATVIRAACVAVLFVLALHVPAAQLFLAAVAVLLVAEPLAEGRFQARLSLRPSLAFAILALVAIALRAVLPLALTDSAVTPGEALTYVPDDLRHKPVLNEAAFGGYLIVQGVRPFIDSRPHYPARFRARAGQLGDNDRLTALLGHYHIRWTLLAPANPAIKALDGLHGWKRLYTGPIAIVHVKDEAL